MKKLTDWVDLMEGELSFAETSDLELLLRHSTEDRRAFLNMTRLRDIVQLTDPIEEYETKLNSPTYQKNLTNKIMDQVKAQAESKSENPETPQELNLGRNSR